MSVALLISARAYRDYDRIVASLVKQSPQGASAWADAFDATIRALPDEHEQQPLAPENAKHNETIRNVLFKTKRGRTYRAIFILRHDTVFVTHIRGPGQRVVPARRFFPR